MQASEKAAHNQNKVKIDYPGYGAS